MTLRGKKLLSNKDVGSPPGFPIFLSLPTSTYSLPAIKKKLNLKHKTPTVQIFYPWKWSCILTVVKRMQFPHQRISSSARPKDALGKYWIFSLMPLENITWQWLVLNFITGRLRILFNWNALNRGHSLKLSHLTLTTSREGICLPHFTEK